MKRCPQCHFTFEDYEDLCDFDGSELTPYPEARDNASAGVTVCPPLYVRVLKSRLGLTLLGIMALICGSLVIGYLDSRNQQNVEAPKVSDKRQPSVSLVAPVKTRKTARPRIRKATPQTQARAINRPTRQLRSKGSQRPRSAVARSSSCKGPLLRPTIAKATPSLNSRRTVSRSQARPANAAAGHVVARTPASKKNDSKVMAIFKKTGSVLKKTVGFLKRPFDL
jgi:hypothetical protein